ncbi:unnamed protein product [Haemonchus placei]|uniref:Reverse transcriptase domain-containing protein n=1 Tax=Haemonchus placei TaxID=6290 RepID=A0A0N4X9B0_HAEPC|nr:unnamed protein product [Haemonchus placei]
MPIVISDQCGGSKNKNAQPPAGRETVKPKENPNSKKDKDKFKEEERLIKGDMPIIISDRCGKPPDDRGTVQPKENSNLPKDEDCVEKEEWLSEEQAKELLNRLSKEMFGEKTEKVKKCTVKRPKNPTAKSTVEEMKRDPGVRDFVYKVIGYMEKYRNRHKKPNLRCIIQSLKKSPSQGLLVKKYPSLKEIRCRLKKERAVYKGILNRLSKEMFGVNLEKVNKCTVKRPKNPTAKGTVKEMNRDPSVRGFVYKVIDLMIKERNRYPYLALVGIGRALKKSPSRDLLLKKYPALKEVIGRNGGSMDKTTQPPDDRKTVKPKESSNLHEGRNGGPMDKTTQPPDERRTGKPKESSSSEKDSYCSRGDLLDCLSQEMFGMKLSKFEHRKLFDPENMVLVKTFQDSKSLYLTYHYFLQMVIDQLTRLSEKEIDKKEASMKITDAVNALEEKARSVLVGYYPSLKLFG